MSRFELAPGKFVGGNNDPTFIIAEGGINHNGDINIAKELILMAKHCKADCIKFQKRTVEKILTREGLEKPYNNPNSFGETYGQHKHHLELSFDDFRQLKEYADRVGILFTASGWDEESIDFLDELGVPFFKLASADLTNKPLLVHTALKGKPMILSTGMATVEEIETALSLVIPYNKRIVLMQCTSSYPTPFEEIHLNVIPQFKRDYGNLAVVGFSGHEKGIAISTCAVALGAKVLERHFTLDRTMKGGDHAASLESEGLAKLVRDIRALEKALGTCEKQPQPSEKACAIKLRKSLVSATFIPQGTTVTREMLTVKGPGTGISPLEIDNIVGKKAINNIPNDIILMSNMFE